MATQYKYDPTNGTWKPVTISDDSGSQSPAPASPAPSTPAPSTPAPSTPKSGTPSPASPGGGGENLASTTGDNLSSKGTTEKEHNEIEMNTLEGTLQVLPTEDTIKINAGDTITLEGLGKYLSGSYYVKEVSRSISTSGYQQSLTVIKTDFGKTLKSSAPTVEKKDPSAPPTDDSRQDVKVPSPQTAKEQTPSRTYTVKKGDCLWNIAKQLYGSGASWKKIYDANTGQIANPNLIYVGQVLNIP